MGSAQTNVLHTHERCISLQQNHLVLQIRENKTCEHCRYPSQCDGKSVANPTSKATVATHRGNDAASIDPAVTAAAAKSCGECKGAVQRCPTAITETPISVTQHVASAAESCAITDRNQHAGFTEVVERTVQTLLQDFAADSEELTKSSSLLSRSTLLASSSKHHVLVTESANEHSNNYPKPAIKDDSLSVTHVPPSKGNQSADADAGDVMSSKLSTIPTFIADSTRVDADMIQVLHRRIGMLRTFG